MLFILLLFYRLVIYSEVWVSLERKDLEATNTFTRWTKGKLSKTLFTIWQPKQKLFWFWTQDTETKHFEDVDRVAVLIFLWTFPLYFRKSFFMDNRNVIKCVKHNLWKWNRHCTENVVGTLYKTIFICSFPVSRHKLNATFALSFFSDLRIEVWLSYRNRRTAVSR